MSAISRAVLRVVGWRLVGEVPAEKCVLIGARHTSNWDFPFALLCLWSLRVRARWVGKHTLFRRPFGWFMRLLGGIPLDRTRTRDFVQGVVDWFEREERLAVVIAPEGTRSRADYWRSGFYWIAHGAGVPIVLGFLDYTKREGGVGDWFVPSGDIEADMDRIRAFYATVEAKRPDQRGEIRLRPREDPA